MTPSLLNQGGEENIISHFCFISPQDKEEERMQVSSLSWFSSWIHLSVFTKYSPWIP